MTSGGAGQTRLVFFVEMACNGMFGNGHGGMIKAPDPGRMFTFQAADVVVINNAAHQLFWDMTMIYDLIKSLDDNHPVAAQAVGVAQAVMNTTTLRSNQSLTSARVLTASILNCPQAAACKMDHDIVALGHCHIDTAWLWPYSETRRKVARSWSTQLALLAAYPLWKFVISQTVSEWVCQREK